MDNAQRDLTAAREGEDVAMDESATTSKEEDKNGPQPMELTPNEPTTSTQTASADSTAAPISTTDLPSATASTTSSTAHRDPSKPTTHTHTQHHAHAHAPHRTKTPEVPKPDIDPLAKGSESSVREYLNENLTQTLARGMKLVVRERPENPLRFLGEWLIEQSKK